MYLLVKFVPPATYFFSFLSPIYIFLPSLFFLSFFSYIYKNKSTCSSIFTYELEVLINKWDVADSHQILDAKRTITTTFSNPFHQIQML